MTSTSGPKVKRWYSPGLKLRREAPTFQNTLRTNILRHDFSKDIHADWEVVVCQKQLQCVCTNTFAPKFSTYPVPDFDTAWLVGPIRNACYQKTVQFDGIGVS